MLGHMERSGKLHYKRIRCELKVHATHHCSVVEYVLATTTQLVFGLAISESPITKQSLAELPQLLHAYAYTSLTKAAH